MVCGRARFGNHAFEQVVAELITTIGRSPAHVAPGVAVWLPAQPVRPQLTISQNWSRHERRSQPVRLIVTSEASGARGAIVWTSFVDILFVVLSLGVIGTAFVYPSIGADWSAAAARGWLNLAVAIAVAAAGAAMLGASLLIAILWLSSSRRAVAELSSAMHQAAAQLAGRVGS